MSIGGLVNMTHHALGKLPCVTVVTSEYSVCCALFAGRVIGRACVTFARSHRNKTILSLGICVKDVTTVTTQKAN
eukprot:10210692-Karenia_brevis.AAC.1